MNPATLSIVPDSVPTFDQFWSLQVKKFGKKPARMVWDRLSDSDKIAAVKEFPLHVAYWTLEGREIKHMPDPRTWLYQERWTDELPKSNGQNCSHGVWWKSETGIMAKGRELGKPPHPGESTEEYRSRLMEAR